LQDYLAHPQAGRTKDAKELLDEIDRASSHARAADLLKQLPEEMLSTFSRTGELPQIGEVRRPWLREVYRRTLQSNLAPELERRAMVEAQRLAQAEAERRAEEEAARRDSEQRRQEAERAKKDKEKRAARIRRTPVFRELTDFVALIRKHNQDYRSATDKANRRILEAVFQGPITGRHALAKLPQHPVADKVFRQWQETALERASAKRANVKERFRTYPEFQKADWDLFDQLADLELDRLLEEIRQTPEDDIGEGLRVLLRK
jgi:hypothetical protein